MSTFAKVMSLIKISVYEVTSGTLTNSDAVPLKLALESSIKKGDTVLLSFEKINVISSSFLNSSIGEIVSIFGFDALKNKIRITNYTPILASVITNYIQGIRTPMVS